MQENRRCFIAFLFLFLSFHQHTSTTAMRIILQRVKSASVTVEDQVVSSIGSGVVALVGLHEHDTEDDLQYCAKRLLGAKLWPNDNGGQWRHGVKQKDFQVLCVSQFTLYGTLGKQNKPDYKLAMKTQQAEETYSQFLELLRKSYQPDRIKDGVFGAMMDVSLINDGPVTIMIESDPQHPDEEGGG